MSATHDHITMRLDRPSLKLKTISLYLACFTTATAYGFIYLLPLLILNLGGHITQVGLFLSIAGVTTISIVGFCGKFAEKFGATKVCIAGVSSCLTGFIILNCATHVSYFFYSAAVFIGLGWSLYYAASPMILNSTITDNQRGKYISNIAAFVVLGTGAGPAMSGMLQQHVSIHILFILPIIFATIAIILFYLQRHWWENTSQNNSTELTSKTSPFLLQIMKSEAKYPLIMVFLGACIFSSMMNFQTIYAAERHLNFSIYYTSYIVSVIISRFLFGGILTKDNPFKSTPYLLLLMGTGLLCMLFNNGHPIIYSISAIALGISYGLVYPLIKTYAINVTDPILRKQVIAYFTQSYFIGVYFFPLLGALVLRHFDIKIFILLLLIICLADGLIALSRTVRKNNSRG